MDATFEQFERAATRLRAMREEEHLPLEDRIHGQLKRWCEEWRDDLDGRPQEVANSRSGLQATMMFRQNVKYFEALFSRLEKRELNSELVAGLWMVVQVCNMLAKCVLLLCHSLVVFMDSIVVSERQLKLEYCEAVG